MLLVISHSHAQSEVAAGMLGVWAPDRVSEWEVSAPAIPVFPKVPVKVEGRPPPDSRPFPGAQGSCSRGAHIDRAGKYAWPRRCPGAPQSALPSPRACPVNSGEVPPSPPPLLLADSFRALSYGKGKQLQDAFSDEILGSHGVPSWFQVRSLLPTSPPVPWLARAASGGPSNSDCAAPEAGSGCWGCLSPQQPLGGGLGIYVS